VDIVRVGRGPRIDGKLDDAVWANAARLVDFHLLGRDRAPSSKTEGSLLTDGQWLYIGVRCEEAAPEELHNKIKRRDDAVNADDSIEIFLDPGTKGARYVHLKLNVGNVQADQLVTNGARDTDWDASWRSGVYLDPDVMGSKGWTVEVAFPLYLLRRMARSPVWRLNLCRNKRTQPVEYTSWSKVKGGFHEPKHFGIVRGLAGVTPDAVFAPIVADTRAGTYRVEGARYAYDVEVDVLNDGGKAGRVSIVLEDRPVSGEASAVETLTTLRPLEAKTLSLTAAIAAPGERQARVVLRDPASGDVLLHTAVTGLDALNPLSLYTDRNFYIDEPVMRVWAVVKMDAQQRRNTELDVEVTVEDRNGRILSRGSAPVRGHETAVTIDIGSVPTGRHVARARLVDSNSRAVGQATVGLRKEPQPAPGVTVTQIDQENRCLLLNGKPFFPVGICQTRMDEEVLQLLKTMGYNAVIRWWGPSRANPIEKALNTLDLARKYGLYMIDCPISFVKKRRPFHDLQRDPEVLMTTVQETRPFLETVPKHPALIAHYGLDEASAGSVDRALRAYLKLCHDLDPYHPVYISGGTAANKGRYDFADLLGAHVYWGPMHVEGRNTPNTVARALKHFREDVTEPARRPLMFIPQSELTSHSRRIITPAERRITVYLGLIHGAKSMIYFASPIRHRATVASMAELSSELHALAPALLTRRPPQVLTVTPNVPGASMPIVQAVLKDHPDGDAVLIVANSSRHPASAVWDLSGLGEGARLRDYFAGTGLSVEGRELADSMEGYATRAWRVTNATRRPGEKVALKVALSGEAVSTARKEAEPAASAKARNLVREPGFEGGGTQWTVVPAKNVTFPQEGRSGSVCLKIEKADADAVVRVNARDVTVRPGYKYRYGCWVKTKLTGGRHVGGVYVHDRSAKPRVRSGRPIGPTHGEWREFSRLVELPDDAAAPADIWFFAQVVKGVTGAIWFDDFFVEEIPPERPQPKPKNVLVNSSFEQAAMPGWPDSWWVGMVTPGQLVGDPGGPGQDDSTAVHGRYSLRIENPRKGPSGHARTFYRHIFGSSGLRGGIPVERGETYVLSLYLKAERPDTPVTVHLTNFAWNSWCFDEGQRERITIGTEWTRHQLVCTYPEKGWRAGVRPEMGIVVNNNGRDCAVWLDAVQFEQGTQATDYEPRERDQGETK